jgi:hypothetical protein
MSITTNFENIRVVIVGLLHPVLSGTAQYLKNYKKEMARDGKKWHPPYSLRKMNQTGT